ncbi:MAG: LacI family DNA-binding transcriptional regulator [Clostridia bacterium]|nr:LacI family DNA-binding transcriptional regulator [Clostridia bacterium]
MKPESGEHDLARIAQKLGVSRATVSKTIRHCSGVDGDTRLRILRAAENTALLHAEGVCDIYCILPDTPSFFWGEMRRGILDGIAAANDALRIKFNVISRLRDEETVLYYLDEAEAMQARILILAVSVTDAVKQRLYTMTRTGGRMILLLSEYGEVTNSFYIGTDAFADGAEMARICSARFPDCTPYLFTVDGNPNVSLRIRGFSAQYGGRVIPIPVDAHRIANAKTLPSHIAAVLSASPIAQEAHAVLYVPFGIPGLQQAIRKARLPGHLSCLCHDVTDAEAISAVCRQDVYAQGFAAVREADRYLRDSTYPPQKHIRIPSVFTCAPDPKPEESEE